MRRFSPLAQRRIRAFAANRRALTALVVFVAVFVLTLFAELIANDRPLLLKYNGKLYFPVLFEYTEQEFGGDFPTPADYRDEFVRQNIEKSGWMIMPPVPFSFNTVDYDLTTPTPAEIRSRAAATGWEPTMRAGTFWLGYCTESGCRWFLLFC